MPDGTNDSELWLLRTYFGGDDAVWTSLTEQARSTRSAVSGAALVVSSDQTQCQQRFRRVLTRLATRAEANDGLYVAIADKQTFVRPDRSLLTIDCSVIPRNAGGAPTVRMAPPDAFRLGIDAQPPNAGHSIDEAPWPMAEAELGQGDSEQTVAEFTASVDEAICASLLWRTEMTQDGSYG